MIEERAKELVDRHYKILTKNYADNDLAQILAHNMWFEESKQCALISVDEILKHHDSLLDLGLKNVHMTLESPVKQYNDVLNPIREYWKNVKKEINKL